MKIPRGSRIEDVPMKSPLDFTNAMRRGDVATRVLQVETPQDYAQLLRLLASVVRPFGIALLTPK